MTNFKLNSKQLESFRLNGYLKVDRIFSLDLCELVLSELKNMNHEEVVLNKSYSKSTYIDKQYNGHSLIEFNGLTYLQKANLYCRSINRFMNLKLLSISGQLLDSDHTFYNDNELHLRQPGLDHTIPAHQDNFYFGLKSSKALTCYVYLTNQDIYSGGLGFYKRSIKTKTMPHDKSKIIGFSSYNKRYELLKDQFSYPVTEPGDVIFHHCQAFHRAFPNKTDKASISASIRVFCSNDLEIDQTIYKNYQQNLTFNKV